MSSIQIEGLVFLVSGIGLLVDIRVAAISMLVGGLVLLLTRGA